MNTQQSHSHPSDIRYKLGQLASASSRLGPDMHRTDSVHQLCMPDYNRHIHNIHQMQVLQSKQNCSENTITSELHTVHTLHIQKEGRCSMNRDEGSYTLSHTYDQFLATLRHCRGQNKKKNGTSFFWCGSLIEIETSKVNIVWLRLM